ncbi:MAG: glycosyltransferase involved in cell wall biosynthesis [Glaciecola sp.]|jgi:glycosyltransferase involved in cell wall biosynthesis
MLLSLVMPVYNEGATLEAAIRALGEVAMPTPWELIVVDDGSTDGAVDGVDRSWVPSAERVLVLRSTENRGKGSALREGFRHAHGDLLGVQDADLEYAPEQIPLLLKPLLEGRADVVFGSREFGAHASFSFWYVVGNRMLSLFASAIFDRYVTDIYTCYKFMTRERYEGLRLTADGFEIEAELVGGLLRSGARVYEVPIDYAARSRAEGKKIHPRDGVKGLLRLLRVRVRGW